LNPPSRMMEWAHMHDFYTRTGVNTIPFGPEVLEVEVGVDAMVHTHDPILCERRRQPVGVLQYISEDKLPFDRRLGPTYLVLGIFSNRAILGREVCIQIMPRQDLFRTITEGADSLRGLWRLVSLKHVSGFSIYQVRF
jgi:hypothetical protein